jgi:hypothetical protein
MVSGLKFSSTTSALHCGPFWLVQVDGDAFLVAVEHGEKAGARAQQMPGAVAFHRLDLDHLGPHVGQHHTAGRAHHHVGEFDHTQAGEGQRRGRDGFRGLTHGVDVKTLGKNRGTTGPDDVRMGKACGITCNIVTAVALPGCK